MSMSVLQSPVLMEEFVTTNLTAIFANAPMGSKVLIAKMVSYLWKIKQVSQQACIILDILSFALIS